MEDSDKIGPGKIGKYQIEAVLGKGAMGIVYQAYDADIQQRVAIKTIREELLEDTHRKDILDRFRNEVIAGRRLKHPNIVSIYEYGEDHGLFYMVMEYVEGRQFTEYLQEGHRFDLTEVQRLMSQLLDALNYAHEHGVVHRDIKPANLMLATTEQLQIMDFGIAKIDISTLTRTGMIVGTPSYMAPEQCLGGKVDARADIFSAGVILYQLITGEKPFDGEASMTIMQKVLNVTPIDPSQLNLHIPKALDGVVRKAMAKRPEDRFQSARAFAEALLSMDPHSTVATALADDPTVNAATQVVQIDTDGHSNKKGLIGLIMLMALIVASAGGYWWNQRTAPETLVDIEPAIVGEPVPPAPSIDKMALDRILASLDCSQVSASVDGRNQVTLTGYLLPTDHVWLQRQTAELPGVTKVDASQLEGLARPHCEVRQLLSALRQRNDQQQLGLQIQPNQHGQRYKEGEFLVLEISTPQLPAYLYVDYYQLDGTVVHLLPVTPEQHKPYSADQRFIIGGERDKEKRWQVWPPFGTEMIVLIASAEPLFNKPRKEIETAEEYLLVLRQALTTVNDDQTVAEYFSITTEAASN